MPHKTKVLKSKRYRVKDSKGRYIYVVIADDPDIGTPYEIWVTMPDENKSREQKLKSEIITSASLFSLAREYGAPYTKALTTMQGTCYSKASIIAMIINLLEEHCPVKIAKMLEFEASEREE